ncbi:MAG: hypothetical protein M3Y60_11525 [Bacteroidota bacterium]|nr:hypothetical protein [Bacteroidota bacterium]
MARIRSFAAPHKGLRNVISKFAFQLGITDVSDASALVRLKALGEEMFVLLNDHVHTENEHTLRHLEERAPGAGAHDRDDHEKLDAIQDNLQRHLMELTGRETPEQLHLFYLKFAWFQSQYLEHINEEETVTELLLQKHFADDELMQHRHAIMKQLKPPMLLLWLKYIIPAQRVDESVGMLSGLKANAPADFFKQVMDILSMEIEPERYHELEVNLTRK